MSRSSRFRVSCKKGEKEEEKINQKLLNKKIEKKLYNKEFIFVANSSERKKTKRISSFKWAQIL